MAKFQIPLNASNFVNQDRQQKFLAALEDQHRIKCQDQEPAEIEGSPSPRTNQNILNVKDSLPQPDPSAERKALENSGNRTGIEKALEHTYTHQSRTMEIHQQYLSHQVENIKLISAVLTQQGKVLDSTSDSQQANIIQTFQRTLDNFHTLREQSLSVHQEFLAQQAEFSERYLSFLENNGRSVFKTRQPAGNTAPPPAEWVVHVPSIVLDDKAPPAQITPADEDPSRPSREVKLPATPSGEGITSERLSQALIHIVAEKTGYPPEMLELNMDLEADLGIDSIKRVEILGTLEDEFPSLPPADTDLLAQTRTLQEIVDYMDSQTSLASGATEPSGEISSLQPSNSEIRNPAASESKSVSIETSAPSHSISDLTSILLEIVAEKTGYPVEMLEAEMDMEADLGIDSIKRVEILGVMEERVPGLPAVEAETLAELRTLGQIADLMSKSQSPPEERIAAAQEEKKKVNPVNISNTPVALASLPEPDKLEFLIPTDRYLIVTSEGTSFTGQIVEELTSAGWKVAVWDFPHKLFTSEQWTSTEGIQRIIQEEVGKAGIDSALDTFRREHGSPAGFIHLHPTASGDTLFSDRESELVKQVFLIAGSLKSDLEQVVPASRNFFLTVTRTDGSLGLTDISSFQEGSGLTGLVKSLNWEWPEVFCRAVDLSRKIDPLQASKLVLQEIHDPDSTLLEIGRSASARVTLSREKIKKL